MVMETIKDKWNEIMDFVIIGVDALKFKEEDFRGDDESKQENL